MPLAITGNSYKARLGRDGCQVRFGLQSGDWPYEAADTGLLSPELVAGIRRVKGVPQLGRRVGNWLSAAEGEHLLSGFSAHTLRDKRDLAIISLLLGCGLRRSEVVALKVGDIQRREDHWAIID